MKEKFLLYTISLPIIIWLPSALGEASTDKLFLKANTPDASIAQQSVTQNMIHLSTLDYTFEINATCREGFKIEAVSLNIADTRKSKTLKRMESNESFEIEMTVPAAQIPPITVDNFCIQEKQTDSSKVTTIEKVPSVLSVQAALLCSNEALSKMTYSSKSLDVVIHCHP